MRPDKMGSFWTKTDRNNVKYLSGTIEIEGKKLSVMLFKNDKKTKDSHPDWELYLKKTTNEIEL